MEPIKVFFMEPTDTYSRALRRYKSASDEADKCPGKYGYHDASVRIEDGNGKQPREHDHPHDDPRWSKKCDYCDYLFDEKDQWQLFMNTIYVRPDTGEKYTLRDAPPGAMYFADWMVERRAAKILENNRQWVGPDGHCLVVMCPDGKGGSRAWMVDDIASNCTRPDDKIHKCWVRHGDVKTGNVHVDKNGDTCNAGAGSILIGNWHGFLHNGYLVTA